MPVSVAVCVCARFTEALLAIIHIRISCAVFLDLGVVFIIEIVLCPRKTWKSVGDIWMSFVVSVELDQAT